MRELRDWQQQALEDLRNSLRTGHRRPMLQAPTGVGKTRLAAAVVNSAMEKRKRVVFAVPALALIPQTQISFFEDGIYDVGIQQADHPDTDPSKKIQICSIQTLARRPDPETDLVIVDEAHLRSKHMEAWMERTRVPFIGLSATPWSRGLGDHWDDLLVAMTTQQAIDDGLLTPFKVFGPDSPSTEGIKVIAGDYHEGQASQRMQENKLVANIVDTWKRLGTGTKTLCFCVDRAHARAVQQQFLEAGILSAYQDAHTPDSERREIKDGFHRGAYPVVCSVGTLILGVDWDVRCIIWARLTKSKILFTQGLGRGLRLAEGKSELLILDHAGTHDKLGFITDLHQEHLHSGKANDEEPEERQAPLPKKCPQCHFIRPPKITKCPNCGFEATAPANKIQTVEGTLVEKTPEPKFTKIQKERQKAKGIKLNGVLVPLREFFGELKGYGQAHQYASGWSSQKFREAVGTWPNAYRDAPIRPCGPEVASYIRSRQIAYAKGQEKKREQSHARWAAD